MTTPRGRKPGQTSTDNGTHSPLYAAMGRLEVGAYVYLETDYGKAERIRSRVTVGDNRKPQFIHGRKFTSELYTAISATNASRVQYLLRIERIA